MCSLATNAAASGTSQYSGKTSNEHKRHSGKKSRYLVFPQISVEIILSMPTIIPVSKVCAFVASACEYFVWFFVCLFFSFLKNYILEL